MNPVETLPIGQFSLSQIEVIGRRTSRGGAVFIIDVGRPQGWAERTRKSLAAREVAKASRPAMLAVRLSQLQQPNSVPEGAAKMVARLVGWSSSWGVSSTGRFFHY